MSSRKSSQSTNSIGGSYEVPAQGANPGFRASHALARGSGLAVVAILLWAGAVEPLLVVELGGGAARVLPFLSLLQLTAYIPLFQDLGSPGPLTWAVFPLYLAAALTTATIVLAKRDATTP